MKQFPFSPLGSCGLWTCLFSICLMILFFCSSLLHPICTWFFTDALNPWEREKEIGEIVKVGHGLSNSPQRCLLKWKKNQNRRKYRVIREKEGEARKWKAGFEKLEENLNRYRNNIRGTYTWAKGFVATKKFDCKKSCFRETASRARSM